MIMPSGSPTGSCRKVFHAADSKFGAALPKLQPNLASAGIVAPTNAVDLLILSFCPSNEVDKGFDVILLLGGPTGSCHR